MEITCITVESMVLSHTQLVTLDSMVRAFRIESQTFEAYKESIPSSEKNISYIKESSGIWILLYRDKQPIGYCAYFPNSRSTPVSCRIREVYVWPEYRKKGYGTLILQTAIDSIKAATPGAIITLMVSERNKVAKSLYKKLGFMVEAKTLILP